MNSRLVFNLNKPYRCLSLSTMSRSYLKPNILVWSTDTAEFARLKSFLQDVLGKLAYTIYPIDVVSGANQSSVWKSNCVVVVTSRNSLQVENARGILAEYLKQGGRVLTIQSGDSDAAYYSGDDESICVSQVNEFACKYSHAASLGRHLILKVREIQIKRAIVRDITLVWVLSSIS